MNGFSRRAIKRALSAIALVVLIGIAVQHEALAASPSLDRQRQLYAEAKSALTDGDQSSFQKIKGQLRDYPLYPYLELDDLTRQMPNIDRRKIDDFLAENSGTQSAQRLLYHWLQNLRKQDRWRDYLDYYDAGLADTEMRCYYHFAQIRNGDREPGITGGIELWNIGKSQPRGCDRLFDLLIEENLIDESLAWGRYTKAILEHQYRLARYIERFFASREFRQRARQYQKVDRDRQAIRNYLQFRESSPEMLAVIKHGLIHLARTDAPEALSLWTKYQQIQHFPVADSSDIVAALVKSLFQQDRIQAADTYLLERIDMVSVGLLEWRLREALRASDWPGALSWLNRLPEEVRREGRWQYWSARIQEIIQPDAASIADTYRKLAATRSFYGFLSSQKLGLPYAMEHRVIAPDQVRLAHLEKLPGVARTRELLFQREMLAARREWFFTARNFSETDWLAAARITEQWHWHYGAIMCMIKASYWDDIEIRFPLAFEESFSSAAKKLDLPPQSLLALARQESAFSPNARSPRGARGLMQLLPLTAKQTARRYHLAYRSPKDLDSPNINIAIGARYYRNLLDRFDQNRISAIAGYNAGPLRVEQWLKQSKGKLPIDVWIETIPFLETRNYVQNVLAFTVIYAHRLKLPFGVLTSTELESRL